MVADTLVRTRSTGGGQDFAAAGVPSRFPYGFPVSPEAAARVVFERMGLRVSETPSAFDQHDESGFGELPVCASWRIVTEAPATAQVENSGGDVTTRVFFVHHAPACYSDSLVVDVATGSQPTSTFLWFPKDTVNNLAASGLDSALVPLVGPLRFTRVTGVATPVR